MDNKEILEKISDLCKPLTPEQREYLTENLTVYTFRKNEAIYSEGEFPTQLMCLLSGKVKIFKNGVSGRNQIIRVIKPVEYFAYRAYFAHQEFLTAAAAFEASTIAMIPMTTITKLVSSNNDLAWFIHQTIICRFGYSRRTYGQLDSKTYTGTVGRVYSVFEGELRTGRRWLHTQHLSIPRRFGQSVQHDNLQRHSHIDEFRFRENHCDRRPENQNYIGRQIGKDI